MAAIPDPEEPERFALNEAGELMSGVWIRPVASEDEPPEPWRHVGWTKGMTFGDSDGL